MHSGVHHIRAHSRAQKGDSASSNEYAARAWQGMRAIMRNRGNLSQQAVPEVLS